MDLTKVPSPCYVMEEDLLRKNLSLIKSVADKAGVEIILAFKAFAMWKSFPASGIRRVRKQGSFVFACIYGRKLSCIFEIQQSYNI